MKRLLLVIFALLLAGCPHKIEAPSTISATGNALSRAEVRRDYTFKELAMVKVTGDGKVHLDAAGRNLLDQKKDLEEAQQQNVAAAKESAAKDETIAKKTTELTVANQVMQEKQKWIDKEPDRTKKASETAVSVVKASPDYRIGHFIMSVIRIAKWLLIAAIVLRVVSLMMPTSWIGTIASFASTLIFGVLTCGISLLQAGADNLHFRVNWTPKAYVNAVLNQAGGEQR